MKLTMTSELKKKRYNLEYKMSHFLLFSKSTFQSFHKSYF